MFLHINVLIAHHFTVIQHSQQLADQIGAYNLFLNANEEKEVTQQFIEERLKMNDQVSRQLFGVAILICLFIIFCCKTYFFFVSRIATRPTRNEIVDQTTNEFFRFKKKENKTT